jgi:hypothetical protein
MNEGKEKGLPDGWTVFYDVRKKKKNNRAVTTIALFPQAFKLFAGSTKTQKMDRSQWPSRWFDSYGNCDVCETWLAARRHGRSRQ